MDSVLEKIDFNTSEITDKELVDGYFQPIIKNDSSSLIRNVKTKINYLSLKDKKIVYSINNSEYLNSYVCSPFNQYFTYAKEELVIVKFKFLKMILTLVINFFEIFAKIGQINKNIIFNNWLLSTNLYTSINENDLEEVVAYSKKKYPNHAIIFRSINQKIYPGIFSILKKSKFKLVGSRQFYYADPSDANIFKINNIKNDLRLLKKSDYEILSNSDILDSDIPRIVDLYNQLYLDKYSYNNPQFSVEFIKNTLKNNLFTYYFLKKNNQIDAVVGLFKRGNVVTPPVVGYDRALPAETGLYRKLMMISLLHAKKANSTIHLSSGASQFKRLRGGSPEIEYIAVYCSHLTWSRKLIWFTIFLLVNKMGIPIMKKFKL